MPLSAATSAREILTGLHEIMAKRGSAQSKLDHVVDLIESDWRKSLTDANGGGRIWPGNEHASK